MMYIKKVVVLIFLIKIISCAILMADSFNRETQEMLLKDGQIIATKKLILLSQ